MRVTFVRSIFLRLSRAFCFVSMRCRSNSTLRRSSVACSCASRFRRSGLSMVASAWPSSTAAPASTNRVIVPAAGANSEGLMAATTRPCTETSRTRSLRDTVASRRRSLGTEILEPAQRCKEGNINQAVSTTAKMPTPINMRCRPFDLAVMTTSCAEVSAIFNVLTPDLYI